MEYKIEIYYSTGNSFGSHNETETLELTWQNIDIAKENLVRIKEHYEMYEELNNTYNNRDRLNILNKNKDKEWFVNEPILYSISKNCKIHEKQKGDNDWEYRFDQDIAETCINLKADNNNTMRMTAFWCGYFETLHSAEIIQDDTDMKISF